MIDSNKYIEISAVVVKYRDISSTYIGDKLPSPEHKLAGHNTSFGHNTIKVDP